MQTLDFPSIPGATLRAIAARHDLAVTSVAPLPQIGVINAIYALGDDYVLRVPRDHPGTLRQAHADAIAAPAARAVGVRTPRLVAYDTTCDILPVPYLIYERVHGRTLGLLDWEPGEVAQVWRELGRDLALLHTAAPGPFEQLRLEQPDRDPRVLAEDRATDGWFTALEVRWLTRWLDRLAPVALIEVPPRPLHLDVQATNIMVRADSLTYLALLDWGCAGRGDPAFDCFGLPLRAIPFVLEGHREVALMDEDDGAEARILWRHLWFILSALPHAPTPGMSWGERPLAWLLEVFRFFQESPHPRWRDLRP